MEAEVDRLRRMYAEMSDEHLEDLAGDREDLTASAQMALTDELRRRGLHALPHAVTRDEDLAHVPQVEEMTTAQEGENRAYGFGTGIPGMVPAAGAGMEQALEEPGVERKGMVRLISFSDGLQLSEACAALDADAISPAIEEVAGDATTGSPTTYEIWVDTVDVDAATRTLRARMELFPENHAEPVDAGSGMDSSAAPAGDMIVAQFDHATEAEEVRATLLQQGFRARIEGDFAESTLTNVLVPADEHERALEMLGALLADEPAVDMESALPDA